MLDFGLGLSALQLTQGEGRTLLRGSFVPVLKGVATSKELLVHKVIGSVQIKTRHQWLGECPAYLTIPYHVNFTAFRYLLGSYVYHGVYPNLD